MAKIDGDLDCVEGALNASDAEIASAVAEHSKQVGRDPSCTSCTTPGCCYQPIHAMIPEALVIARRLIRDGRNTRAFREKLSGLWILQDGVSEDEWWRRSIPCPLLSGGRCSVYAQRPLACRAHYAWADASRCCPPSEPLDRVHLLPLSDYGLNVYAAAADCQDNFGFDRNVMGPGALPGMVYLSLESLRSGDPAPWRIASLFEKNGMRVIATPLPPGDPDTSPTTAKS